MGVQGVALEAEWEFMEMEVEQKMRRMNMEAMWKNWRRWRRRA